MHAKLAAAARLPSVRAGVSNWFNHRRLLEPIGSITADDELPIAFAPTTNRGGSSPCAMPWSPDECQGDIKVRSRRAGCPQVKVYPGGVKRLRTVAVVTANDEGNQRHSLMTRRGLLRRSMLG